ncbi:hypothetical protein QJS66_12985 [Kocuria rhizophila]|nr:hypothetical protein QJS66_12985 [Kocuria rhizophila]
MQAQFECGYPGCAAGGARLLDNVDTFPQAEWAGASSADIVRHVRENTAAAGMVVAPIVTDELVPHPSSRFPRF